MAIPITKLNKYLMENTNQENMTAVEAVQRYLDLIKLYREMQKSIRKDGARIVVKNGSQEFIKSHPLISDMKNINAQLINLKKDIDKHIEEYAEYRKKESANYDAGELM